MSRLGPWHRRPTPLLSNHCSMLLTIEDGLGLGELGYTSDCRPGPPALGR